MHAATAVKTDADALADAIPCCIGVTSDIKSYSYIIISLPAVYAACEPREKGENDSGEFIRHRECKFARGHQKSAIYRGVKAKVPIIGVFKGS